MSEQVFNVYELEAKQRAQEQRAKEAELKESFESDMQRKGYYGNEPAYWAEAIRRGVKDINGIKNTSFLKLVKRELRKY